MQTHPQGVEARGSKHVPAYYLYQVRDKEGQDKGYWTKIGAAWPHKDGKGFRLKFDAFPLNALPEKEQRLFLLTLSLVEVSNLVERYKRREAIIAISPLDYSSVQ